MERTREKHGGDVEKDVAGTRLKACSWQEALCARGGMGVPPTLRGLWLWQNVPGQQHP